MQQPTSNGYPAGAVVDFGRSCLPGRTSRHCRDQFAGNDTMQAAILSELHTRFALRRKSFPAERTYSDNHPRLHPTRQMK